MSDNPTECPKLDTPEKKKLKPGQKKENRTVKDQRNAMRQSKTRAIKKITNTVSTLRSLEIEPVEVLVLIKEVNTQKFKIIGEGEMLENFINGKPLSNDPPKIFRKYNTENKISAANVTSDTLLQRESKQIAQPQLTRLQEISVHTEDSAEVSHSEMGKTFHRDNMVEVMDKHEQWDLVEEQDVFLGQQFFNSNEYSDKMNNAENCEMAKIFDGQYVVEDMESFEKESMLGALGILKESDFLPQFSYSSGNIDNADNSEMENIFKTDFVVEDMKPLEKEGMLEDLDILKESDFLPLFDYSSGDIDSADNLRENGNIPDIDYSLEHGNM